MIPRILILTFLILCIFKTEAQIGFTTNNNNLEEIYERFSILYPSENLFQNLRPYHRGDINQIYLNQKDNDSNFYDKTFSTFLNIELHDNLFCTNKRNGLKTHGFFYPNPSSLAEVDRDFLQLSLNPILELKAGKETESDALVYQNTRGVEIKATLGGQIYLYTQITENQIKPFQYIHDYGTGFNGQTQNNFNPYYTYWKDINENKGYDFSNAIGYVEYKPSRFISVIMGHDRNHYGYGYRSLLLGDNGAPYFQLKLNAKIWKFHYQALFAEFTGQYIRGGDKLLPKKYGAFHLLTYKPSKKLEFGVYEGIMFHRDNGFELNYLNPVIFYHSIEHAVGSSDNVMMGAQAKYNLNTHTQFYSQFLLDDLQVGQFLKGSGWWGNKYGIQLGTKFVDIANINTLDAQVEMNLVSPFTYSHYANDSNEILDNFTHYNQPIAHPFGANFIELYSRLSYRPMSKLKIELKYNFSAKGMDMNGLNYGNNLFSNANGNNIFSEYNNSIAQGDRLATHFIQLSNQFMFYHNMYFDLDFIYRNSTLESTQNTKSSFGILAGIRVNLRKRDYVF
jgi:hypothetical protein